MRLGKNYMYVLIDYSTNEHYGFTYDELKAREKADELDRECGTKIDIYVLVQSDEF